MATYNRKHLISRAVDSLLNQSYPNWELIIVDDGSEDYTDKLIKDLFGFHNKIRYYKREHKGLAASRNFGIKNSVGSFLTFLDSDDEYEIDHLKLRAEFMKNNPKIDLIEGGIKIIGEPDKHYVPDKNDTSKLIHLNECIIGATLFGKRRVFEKLNGFKDIYSEDSDFVLRAVEYFNVHKVDFPTYKYYRDTPDSI